MVYLNVFCYLKIYIHLILIAITNALASHNFYTCSLQLIIDPLLMYRDFDARYECLRKYYVLIFAEYALMFLRFDTL